MNSAILYIRDMRAAIADPKMKKVSNDLKDPEYFSSFFLDGIQSHGYNLNPYNTLINVQTLRPTDAVGLFIAPMFIVKDLQEYIENEAALVKIRNVIRSEENASPRDSKVQANIQAAYDQRPAILQKKQELEHLDIKSKIDSNFFSEVVQITNLNIVYLARTDSEVHVYSVDKHGNYHDRNFGNRSPTAVFDEAAAHLNRDADGLDNIMASHRAMGLRAPIIDSDIYHQALAKQADLRNSAASLGSSPLVRGLLEEFMKLPIRQQHEQTMSKNGIVDYIVAQLTKE